MDPQSLFLSNLALIERVIAGACRRHSLYDADAEDFASWVKTRMIENDYQVLRRYEGRSSLQTYLVVVITNLLRDYNVQRWGRWRASAEAKRLGTVAVRLESLIYRDGHTVAEAASILRSRGAVALSDRELAEIAGRVPARRRPQQAGEEHLWSVAADSSADEIVTSGEQHAAWSEVQRALGTGMAALSAEDRMILRLRFWEGLSVADIARTLHIEQKPLYRRMDRLLAALRSHLQQAGVSPEACVELVGQIPHLAGGDA